MPELSESPEIIYCATVLAKASRDANAFAGLHDVLGNLYNAKQLDKIEELASKYTDLPDFLLERKISWLQSLGVKPLDLTAIFSSGAENGAKSSKGEASKKKKGPKKLKAPAKDDDETVKESTSLNPQPIPLPCPTSSESQVLVPKKKNKKGKKKKNQSFLRDNKDQEKVVALKETEVMGDVDEISKAIDELNEAESASTLIKHKKKKKKKKPKSSHMDTKNEKELDEVKPPEAVECKSLEEVLPSALDSGIGSCVASGGEDKSSILSGGTIESNGENVESATPMLNFEWEGNMINEYLQSEKIIFENIEKDFISKNSDSSKRFEISFGTPIEDTNTKKASYSIKNLVGKSDKKSDNGTKFKKCEILSKKEPAPPSENVKKLERFFAELLSDNSHDTVPKSSMPCANESKNSTFDHDSAVKFLWNEWNRTVESSATQYLEISED